MYLKDKCYFSEANVLKFTATFMDHNNYQIIFLLLYRKQTVASNLDTFINGGAPSAPVRRARRAPWVRKNGNPSMREILIKASGMARGRVHLRPTAYGVRHPR